MKLSEIYDLFLDVLKKYCGEVRILRHISTHDLEVTLTATNESAMELIKSIQSKIEKLLHEKHPIQLQVSIRVKSE